MQQTAKSFRAQRMSGFTLLEALITITILTILVMMGIPSFREFQASRSVSAQVSDIAGSLRLARTEAIKRGVPVTICRSANPDDASPTCTNGNDWSSGWLIFADRGTRGVIETGDTLISVQRGYRNSGGIVFSAGAANIRFQPTGIAPGAQGSFLLRPPLAATHDSYSRMSRRVCINSTGGTRLVVGDAACS